MTHPDIASEHIGQALGLEPKFAYTAGGEKITPKGNLLPGVRSETYWMYELAESGDPFDTALLKLTGELLGKKNFFEHFSDSGGQSEFFVGWFSPENSGFVLNNEIIKNLSDLRIRLSFDIYGKTRSHKNDTNDSIDPE